MHHEHVIQGVLQVFVQPLLVYPTAENKLECHITSCNKNIQRNEDDNTLFLTISLIQKNTGYVMFR